VGLAIGAAAGVLLGLIAFFTPPEGVSLAPVVVLATALGGAAFGAWVGSLAGAGVPNSRLRRFHAAIERGSLLMMVDVPFRRVDEIRELVHRRHPEASGGSVEPTMPAFP
jgi:hypothetical protein